MAVQTSFSRYSIAPKPGFDSDQGRGYIREGQNRTGADLDVGLAVKQDASHDSGVLALAASSDPVVGFTMNDQGRNPNGATTSAYPALRMLPVKCEGALWAQCDQDMKPGDKVFVRFAASANAQTGAIGSVRKDPDGVAQVSTGTPTAVNSQVYVVRVGFDGLDAGTRPASYEFEYQGDGSATATEIVTGLKAAMAADAAFTARVVATGTTTLILTGQVAGEAFTVTSPGDGAISWAATTPPAPSARRLKGARVLSSGTAANGAVELYVSAAAESP
jgi:hypothetical protein